MEFRTFSSPGRAPPLPGHSSPKHFSVPDMTYNVFGGSLNLAQSVHPTVRPRNILIIYLFILFAYCIISAFVFVYCLFLYVCIFFFAATVTW